jgi:amidase
MRGDQGVDAVIETAVAVLRNRGAEVVDITIPRYVLGLASGLYEAIHDPEFHYQIEDYLATLPDLGPDQPRTIADIVRLTEKITAPTPEGWVPNPNRLASEKKQAKSVTLHDTPYLDALNEGRKIVRENLTWILEKQKLDAFIVPTNSRPTGLISAEAGRGGGAAGGSGAGAGRGGAAGRGGSAGRGGAVSAAPAGAAPSAGAATPTAEESPRGAAPAGGGSVAGSVAQISNISGWPDLVVPAGFTSEPLLPVCISFIGPAFSEDRLLAYGYAFELALPARRLPVHTPVLPGEKFDYEIGVKK